MAKKGIIKKYKCTWPSCIDKPEFEKEVVYDAEAKYGTPVVCPYCTNLIPTWKREETGNVVGRKHIHIRR